MRELWFSFDDQLLALHQQIDLPHLAKPTQKISWTFATLMQKTSSACTQPLGQQLAHYPANHMNGFDYQPTHAQEAGLFPMRQ